MLSCISRRVLVHGNFAKIEDALFSEIARKELWLIFYFLALSA
jgi:hypothetical protein